MSDAKVNPIEMAEGSNILATTCEAIVIPTNCRAVANGAGLAKAAALRFKGWSKEHREMCGALILLEKMRRPSQMMRIAARLGIYDRSKLDMRAPVYATFAAMREAQKS